VVTVILMDREDAGATELVRASVGRWRDSMHPSWGSSRDGDGVVAEREDERDLMFAEEPSSGGQRRVSSPGRFSEERENERPLRQLPRGELESDSGRRRPAEPTLTHLTEEDLDGLSSDETRTVLLNLAAERRALQELFDRQQQSQRKQQSQSQREVESGPLSSEYEEQAEQAYQIAASAQQSETTTRQQLDARVPMEKKTGYSPALVMKESMAAVQSHERQRKAASRREVLIDEQELEAEQAESYHAKVEQKKRKQQALVEKYYRRMRRQKAAKAAERKAFIKAAKERGTKEGFKAIHSPSTPEKLDTLELPVGRLATQLADSQTDASQDPKVLRMQDQISHLEGVLKTQQKQTHEQQRNNLRQHRLQQRRMRAQKLRVKQMQQRAQKQMRQVAEEEEEEEQTTRQHPQRSAKESALRKVARRPRQPAVMDDSKLSEFSGTGVTTGISLSPKHSTSRMSTSRMAAGDASAASSSLMKKALRSIKHETVDDPVADLPKSKGKEPEIPHTENKDDAEWSIIEYSIWGTVGALVVGLCGVIIYCACKQPRDRPWGLPPKRQF